MREKLHINHSTSEIDTTTRARLWLWPNLLSLDAPAVALLWQILFVRCFHSKFEGSTAVMLALAVWLIYAGDRMLDALRGSCRTLRHAFYRRHWRTVCALWTAAFVACGWLAWTELSAQLWTNGLLVTSVVGIYLAIVHGVPKLFGQGIKEAAVGVVFAAGVSLVAWPMVRTGADFLAIVLFCILCWMNCVGIEDWEAGSRVRASAIYAAGGVALLAVFLLPERRPVLACAETASALGLVLLDRLSGRISREAMRVLADVMLLTPLLFLNVAGKFT